MAVTEVAEVAEVAEVDDDDDVVVSSIGRTLVFSFGGTGAASVRRSCSKSLRRLFATLLDCDVGSAGGEESGAAGNGTEDVLDVV